MGEEQQERKPTLWERLLPVRYIYLRCHDNVSAYALTGKRQILFGFIAFIAVGWTLVASGSFLFDIITRSRADQEIIAARAASERLNADLQARLESAVSRMSATNGTLQQTADMVERRHAALAQVMTHFQGVEGAEQILQPLTPAKDESPVSRILAVRLDQEHLLDRAESFAQGRAERLRLAFRLAGLNPSAYAPSPGQALGGPLIEARDPRALAAILDVDEPFAIRIKHAADNLSEMNALNRVASHLPFKRPTEARVTSGYGVRFDPFNGRPAVHQGQDFAAPLNTPIHATAPGVVSFSGVRSGYGNTVELDHGRGFKTRYAHLNTLAVQSGQSVALGQRIGAMGTTGRSTGVHLHYEVWLNGRPLNPARFLRAGEQLVQ